MKYKLKPKSIVESVNPLNEVALLKDQEFQLSLGVDDESDREGD